MQVHLWLETKVSGGPYRRGPMVNTMFRYISNPRWEAEDLLVKT
jgi:hypothetical protein